MSWLSSTTSTCGERFKGPPGERRAPSLSRRRRRRKPRGTWIDFRGHVATRRAGLVDVVGLGRHPARPPRLPAARAAAPAHHRRRRRHAVPLPDRGLASTSTCCRACACTAGIRARTSATRCCSTTSRCPSSSCRPWPRWSGLPVAFKLGTVARRLPAAAARLRGLPAHGLPLPGAAAGRGGGARLPVPRGEPDLGRHASPARSPASSPTPTASASPSCSWASSTARTRADWSPWLPAAVLALTALAHGYAVLWAGLVRVLLPVRRAPAPRARWAGWPLVGGARLRAGRLLAAAAARGLGLDDALRRPLDHGEPAQPVPAAAVAALRGRGWRASAATLSCGRRAGGPDHRLLFLAARRARGGGAGRGGARARHHRRPLRAVRAARAVPGRRGVAWASCVGAPGRARPGRARPRAGWRSSTATPARTCCAPGSTGTTPGLEAKELWPAFRAHDGDARRAAWATRGWPSSTAPSTRRRAPSACTRRCRSSRAAPRSRASTTRPACRPTPSTTWPRSWARPRRTRSGSASTRPSTPTTPCATCACSTSRDVVALSPQLAASLAARAGRRARRARPALHGLPPARPRAGLRGAAGLRARALVAARLARQGLPLVHAQAASAARTSSSPTTPRFARASRRDEWLAAARGAAARRRARCTATVEAESDHASRTNRVGPSAAGEGLVPPALARGGRGRAVPRLAGADDGRAAAARRSSSSTRGRRPTALGLAAHAARARRRGRGRRAARAGRRAVAPGARRAVSADSCEVRPRAAAVGRRRSRRARCSCSAPSRGLSPCAKAAAGARAALRGARRAPTPRSGSPTPPSTRATRSTGRAGSPLRGRAPRACAARACCARGSRCGRAEAFEAVLAGARRRAPTCAQALFGVDARERGGGRPRHRRPAGARSGCSRELRGHALGPKRRRLSALTVDRAASQQDARARSGRRPVAGDLALAAAAAPGSRAA